VCEDEDLDNTDAAQERNGNILQQKTHAYEIESCETPITDTLQRSQDLDWSAQYHHGVVVRLHGRDCQRNATTMPVQLMPTIPWQILPPFFFSAIGRDRDTISSQAYVCNQHQCACSSQAPNHSRSFWRRQAPPDLHPPPQPALFSSSFRPWLELGEAEHLRLRAARLHTTISLLQLTMTQFTLHANHLWDHMLFKQQA